MKCSASQIINTLEKAKLQALYCPELESLEIIVKIDEIIEKLGGNKTNGLEKDCSRGPKKL